jgi:plasmid stabilization system protein ParE
VSRRVVILRRAAREIADNYGWLAGRSKAAADRWQASLLRAIDALAEDATRYPLAPEDEFFTGELRELLHGRRRTVYRVLFEVIDDAVYIVRVRHSSQDALGPGDF